MAAAVLSPVARSTASADVADVAVKSLFPEEKDACLEAWDEYWNCVERGNDDCVEPDCDPK